MTSLRAAVILFPGSNREGDFVRAWRLTHGKAPAIVWHDESALPGNTDLVVLPGGFSYGDYLRCGAIAARTRVMEAVRSHAAGAAWCSGSATASRFSARPACCRGC